MHFLQQALLSILGKCEIQWSNFLKMKDSNGVMQFTNMNADI
jgi:hypothetical protein